MVSRRTVMQNRSRSCSGRGLLGGRVRRALSRELRRYPEAGEGAAGPRAVADLHGDAGPRALPQSPGSRRPALCDARRVHGVCQPGDAFATRRHGARADGAEAPRRTDAPDAGRRSPGPGWNSRTTGGPRRRAGAPGRVGPSADARGRDARDHGHGSVGSGAGAFGLRADRQARLATGQGFPARSPGSAAVSDAAALAWLDRLLSADESQRENLLGELGAADAALRTRVERMLAVALAPDHSRVLGKVVVDGLTHLNLEAAASLQEGMVLAGYRLIRELGRGGMAVVWLAERADGVVKRQVALKMPMFILQGEVDVARFARERDALASLSHPNVARLYDAGVLPSGQPFIVLERVDGVPLTLYCDERKLDVIARLRLFFQVLAAVDHAHKHLLVHRDLKPSNILVDAEGQVKLLDFGIAKLLDDSEAATAPLTEQAGGAMTPLYAAPEQLRGGAISTLTDVYSLGVVLHELLAGALPYRAPKGGRASLVDVLEAQGRGELPRASLANIEESAALARGTTVPKLRAALAGDLDTIIGKAMRIAPDQRYDSVAHVAEDLRRFLSHRPIAARRPGLLYTARLALVRHRFAATVGAAGLVSVGVAGVVAWQQHRESVAHAERTAAV